MAVQELEPFQTEKNALPTSGRGFLHFCFLRKTADQQNEATHIYSLEYINWCKSHAFCHIPTLNHLP